MTREAGRRFCIRSPCGSRPRIDHEIDHRQEMPVLSEIFPDPAFDAVPRDCAACGAHTDRKAEPRVIQAIQLRAHEKE